MASTTFSMTTGCRLLTINKGGLIYSYNSSRHFHRFLNTIALNRSNHRRCHQIGGHSGFCHSFSPMRLLSYTTRCSPSWSLRRVQLVRFSSTTSSETSQQQAIEGDANIQYRHGLPVLTLTLPSRGERCEFALRPITETVADLCDYVRREDKGIETICVYSASGVKIAGSTSIEHLMQSDFQIRLNDRLYLASSPKHGSVTSEHMQQLNDVKALVASLHASLNADEQCLRAERELATKLETVRQTLEPLEKQKKLLSYESDRRTNRLLWLGLALMGVQIGALARLTWFEYSWDIVEPVTYFTTYTAVIAGYAYFCATRNQYEYPDAKERMALNKFYKLSRKKGFDIEKYNRTKESLHELEKDLQQLRRTPIFASYKHTPYMEQTITVIRDSKHDDIGERSSTASPADPADRWRHPISDKPAGTVDSDKPTPR